MSNVLSFLESTKAGPDPASTEKGGVTHISKDSLRERGYHQANCTVFLPK